MLAEESKESSELYVLMISSTMLGDYIAIYIELYNLPTMQSHSHLDYILTGNDLRCHLETV